MSEREVGQSGKPEQAEEQKELTPQQLLQALARSSFFVLSRKQVIKADAWMTENTIFSKTGRRMELPKNAWKDVPKLLDLKQEAWPLIQGIIIGIEKCNRITFDKNKNMIIPKEYVAFLYLYKKWDKLGITIPMTKRSLDIIKMPNGGELFNVNAPLKRTDEDEKHDAAIESAKKSKTIRFSARCPKCKQLNPNIQPGETINCSYCNLVVTMEKI